VRLTVECSTAERWLQDRLQMSLAGDQHAIQELATQGSDQPLADRVAPHRQLHPIRTIGIVASG
jgi:hypothetical protein